MELHSEKKFLKNKMLMFIQERGYEFVFFQKITTLKKKGDVEGAGGKGGGIEIEIRLV